MNSKTKSEEIIRNLIVNLQYCCEGVMRVHEIEWIKKHLEKVDGPISFLSAKKKDDYAFWFGLGVLSRRYMELNCNAKSLELFQWALGVIGGTVKTKCRTCGEEKRFFSPPSEEQCICSCGGRFLFLSFVSTEEEAYSFLGYGQEEEQG